MLSSLFFSKFQIFIFLSTLVEATKSPINTIFFIRCSRLKENNNSKDFLLHTFIVLSELPLIILAFFASIDKISPVWPFIQVIRFCVFRFQILIDMSQLPVKKMSFFTQIAEIRSSWAKKLEICVCFCKSQMIILLSSLPEIKNFSFFVIPKPVTDPL